MEHRQGTRNVVPDMLSRMDMEEILIDVTSLIDFDSEALRHPDYLNIFDTVEQNKDRLPDLKVCESIVYKRVKVNRDDVENEGECWKIWLPGDLTPGIIQRSHENNTCHGSVAKTLHNVRQYFFWPSMVTQVRQFVSDCSMCKEIKHPNRY